jgi:hypothetical protein
MKRITPFVALAVFCAIGGAARAVHLDVWVHKDIVNRVDSGYFDVNAGVPITPMDRALGWDFQEFDQDPYYANNPGYFAESNTNPGGSQLPGGSLVGFNVLSDLQYWDGNGPVSFGPVPAGETISINLGSSANVVVGTGTGAQPGFTLQQVASGTAEGFLHIHVNANIGAPNGVPTDGIYIFQERLTSNAPGVTNSLPFWIVFNNNISEDQRGEAINFLYPNQWCGPLGGSYNINANWSGNIPLPGQIVPVPQSPNGQDTVANFLDNLYADSTVTIDSPATVGIINFKSVPRYTLGGSASLTLQSSTTAQINLKLGNHTIAAPLVIASNTVIAAGTNRLDLQGAQTWNDNTTLTLQSGTLNYSIASGSTTVGANVQLAIAAGASVNVNGPVNPFADAAHPVSIANDSATGLNINAAGIRVGRITGSGTTAVAVGSQLTADSIIQGALVIGGTASNPAMVTIDASDSLGNPLTDDGLALAGSLLSGSSFANGIDSKSLIDAKFLSSASSTSLAGNLGGSDFRDNSGAVPEPSAMLLALVGFACAPYLVITLLRPRRFVRPSAFRAARAISAL